MLNGDSATDCEFRMSLNSSDDIKQQQKHPPTLQPKPSPMMYNGESETPHTTTSKLNKSANHHENGNQHGKLQENGDKETVVTNSGSSNGDLRKRLVDTSKENNCDISMKKNGTADKKPTESKQDDLLHWRDMPKHLQFNPYIFTGYRPMLSIWGCINSLFYMHNETINIITHAVPIVYILVTVPSLMPWQDPEFRFLSWCHLLGSVSPWIGSFLYHLFMNLEQGEGVYYRLLQLDMLGIWISQSFGAIPMVVATVYCLPMFIRWGFILGYCVLSLWGLYKAMTAWSPWERRLCFLLPFSMRMVLCGLRVSNHGGGDPAALTHVFLQDVVSVIGAAIGAMHIPEKWFPGTVDMYLNSHNIMHVLVVAAVYHMHVATLLDFSWMTLQCNAPAAAGIFQKTVETVAEGL